ncbi:MAG: DUF4037 domain-containing protein [Spirochaetaceae bacterium]
MKGRTEDAVASIAERLDAWPSMDTITLVESGSDTNDPYFFVSLDAYHRGDVPGEEERRREFHDAVAFESIYVTQKDRFLLHDIPVRIEYKNIHRFDEIVRTIEGNRGFYRDSGTYMFYRMKHSTILKQKSDWLTEVRKDLDAFTDGFWDTLRSLFQARMEHYLGDLHAAVIREDPLFYLVSASGFIRSVASVLFAVNRQFEPAPRSFLEEVPKLPALPDSFHGRFDSFLRTERELTRDRKLEVATLLAQSLIAL